MILLFSSSVDYSTYEVMKWLHYLGEKEVLRVNSGDKYCQSDLWIDIVGNDFVIQVQERQVLLQDIKAVWYRKGKYWLCDQFYPAQLTEHPTFTHYLNEKIKNERVKLSEYLHYLIEQQIPCLGNSRKSDLNKLIVLDQAQALGLAVPPYQVANHATALQNFQDQKGELITKALSDGIYIFENQDQEIGYFTYTEQLSAEKIQALPPRFSPSFIQQKIDKKYEVRVFYLEGACYAMAILSQSDEKTKVDYRKYNRDKPNRFVPYRLPSEIKDKTLQLFQNLGLNTGSVDFMVDQKEVFYFLEINPVGQFGMVSKPCNYFLEKKVAQQLINYER